MTFFNTLYLPDLMGGNGHVLTDLPENSVIEYAIVSAYATPKWGLSGSIAIKAGVAGQHILPTTSLSSSWRRYWGYGPSNLTNEVDFVFVPPPLSVGSMANRLVIYSNADSGYECPHPNGDCNLGIHNSKSNKTSSDPIDIQYGEKREKITDLQLNTVASTLAFTRSYRQDEQENTDADLRLGRGWHHNHMLFLVDKISTIDEIHVYMPTGSYARFEATADSTIYQAMAGGTSRIVIDSGSTNARYSLEASDQTFIYDDAGKITKRQWSNSEEWIYSYYSSGYASGLLEKVADSYGRELRFTYIDNSSAFDDLQLWRVGDQTASGLDGVSPGGRYVEFTYVENKVEDIGNPGTAINGGEPLLESVTDVRGYTWEYEYEQTDIASLNFLYRYLSPSVDSDGDGLANSAITIKELDYTLSGGAMQSINQKVAKQGSGNFLEEEDYVFQAGGQNKTTFTAE